MKRISVLSLSVLLPLVLLAALLAACGGNPAPEAEATAAAATQPAAQPEATKPVSTAPPVATIEPTEPAISPAATEPAGTEAAVTQAASEGAPAAGGSDDVIQALIDSRKAQLEAKVFRAQMTSILTGTGETYTTTIEYILPDRYYINIGDQEIMVISPTTYIRPAGGEWMISMMDMSAALDAILEGQDDLENVENLSNVQFAGEGEVNGEPARILQFDSSEEGVESTTWLWISKRDNRPLKMEVISSDQTQPSKTIVIYEYDPSIRIEPPPTP